MSSHQEKPGAQQPDVSLQRRRLVKGAAAAVPAILTLRSGVAHGMSSIGLATASDADHAVVAVVDNPGDPSHEQTGALCVGANDAPGYADRYEIDPNNFACAAQDTTDGTTTTLAAQNCSTEQMGNGYTTGILVSSQSLASVMPHYDGGSVEVSKLCNQ